ncbi:MAG: hypothetical protein ACYTET_00270 [Planctomycetota bacterium]|jgi:cytoskeletal protein RodZ
MEKPIDKTRVIVWSVAVLFIVIFAFFGPSSIVQSRNMEKARLFHEVVTSRQEFTNIDVRLTTANLGRTVGVVGTVEKQEDLTALEKLAVKHLPAKFEVFFAVEVEETSGTKK